jgi:Mn-dependent DtxR family transcriptional regulator
MPLTPVQSLVHVSLIVYIRDQLEGKAPLQAYGVGATVEELSERLGRSPASIRSALNELSKVGLVVSESPGRLLLLAPSISAKKKIWKPTHRVDEEGIKQLLKKHPEIVEHLGKDVLEQVLKMKL